MHRLSRIPFGRLRLACVGLFLLCAAHCTPALSGKVYPADAWNAADAGAVPGWSQEGLEAADAFAAALRTDAYLVVQHGMLVHRYGDITRPLNIFSARKSLLSVLIGMAVDRGAIDLDRTLAELEIDDKDGLSATEKSATVRQLLQARSGVYHDAAYETLSMKRDRPRRGSHAPGEFWYYNNWDFNALGLIFQSRTGKTVFEALRDDLAGPLQFQDFRFPRDTEFVHESASDHPAYVMKLSARDLARVGLLMARSGQWRDRQLMSADWVAASTAPHSTVGPGWQGYGYMWWVPLKAWPFWKRSPGDVFFAWGNGGQFVLVDRGRDLVIVHQVDTRRLFHGNVDPETLGGLLARILAAAPAR